MNALFLALLSLSVVASSVRGQSVAWSYNAQWSSNVTMQISKEAACSGADPTALETEVGEWLQDELIDLFGEGTFALGSVPDVEVGTGIALVGSVECLESTGRVLFYKHYDPLDANKLLVTCIG
jgi:hypothetical protein